MIGWILASAFFLALYDLAKKASVRDNAVLPVLVISTACGFLAYVTGLFGFGNWHSAMMADSQLLMLAAAKVVIVGTSWILTFCGLRKLPITIATPIRASAPAVVILFALLIYSERPSLWQWLGMLCVFAGFFMFSWAGKAEGIDFLRNRSVWCAVGGMLMSATSALWDKYVFQVAAAPVETIQFYFQLGLFGFYSMVLLFLWALRNFRLTTAVWGPPTVFQYRWTIPLVGILLAAADWLYFHGLAIPEAPISVASLLRRFSVVLTFVLGALIFRERNLRRKGLALAVILVGTVIICLSSVKS